VVHQAHVSRLSAWVLPYPAGYVFPVPFGVLAFASWAFLLPLKGCVFLAVDLLACARPQWGFHVALQWDATGEGALSTPGSGCPSVAASGHHALWPNIAVFVNHHSSNLA